MGMQRIDGSVAALTLMERISSEERVGESLSDRTKANYQQKIKSISRKVESSGKGNLTPTLLVDHLLSLIESGSIAQSTARTMKAVGNYWLADRAQRLLDSGADNAEFEAAYLKLKTVGTKDLPRQTDRTSSTKLKYFPKPMIEALVEYNNQSRRWKNGGALISFIKANLLVGLRPEEWFGARFSSYIHSDDSGKSSRERNSSHSSTLSLIVDNSKTTYGRSNGKVREILLNNVSDEDLALIMHFLQQTREFASQHHHGLTKEALAKKFFKPLQRGMTEALKKLGYGSKSLPTTYSTRHQAVANAKASGLSFREIAAMFGHISQETSKTHYGRKANGWAKTAFRPTPESLMAVPEVLHVTKGATPATSTLETAAEWNRMRSSSKDIAP